MRPGVALSRPVTRKEPEISQSEISKGSSITAKMWFLSVLSGSDHSPYWIKRAHAVMGSKADRLAATRGSIDELAAAP